MLDILFARTFVIIGGMLLITSITARINKAFETKKETFLTIGGTFALLFAIMIFADSFPSNIILVALFSGLMGWEIGPLIEFYGRSFKMKKFLKEKGIILKKGEPLDAETQAKLKTEFEQTLTTDPHANEWHHIVFQALFSTALAVFATAGMVFLTSIDFSFLGGFLLIALIILIVMSLINAFIYKSAIFSLIKAYFGVVIFTLYLLYDFNTLEKFAGDQSWSTAINIAVNIYLDIINLFLSLLEILSSSSD